MSLIPEIDSKSISHHQQQQQQQSPSSKTGYILIGLTGKLKNKPTSNLIKKK